MEKNKICPACEAANNLSAKFCNECGTNLQLDQDKKQCLSCGFKNSNDSKFCFNCGEAFGEKKISPKLKQKQQNRVRREKKHTPETKSVQPLTIAVIAIALVVVYLFLSNDNKPQALRPVAETLRPFNEQKLADPAKEAIVLDIASRFICSCGTCGEQPLNTCTCDVAKMQRDFIRNGLQNNQDQETIIKAVNAKYGWIKPEFEDKYGPGKFRLGAKQNNTLAPGLDILGKKNVIKPALFSDRLSIISSFACTCGQCQIDELKDCNCNHPGGATEVKKFIDQKIAEASYSKENIIQLVEARYGNRIR